MFWTVRIGLVALVALVFFGSPIGPGLSQTGPDRLTGSDRASFVEGTANACARRQATDEETARVPKPLFEKYCRCYANGLADTAPINDLKANHQAVMRPIIQAVGRRCYNAMKEEASRLPRMPSN